MRPPRTPRRLLELAVAALLLAAAPAARAQAGGDAESKALARKLATEGQKLFDAGEYAAALEKFNTADSLNPTPTIGLRAARCLAKLGRVVEASERYLDVTRTPPAQITNPVLRKAVADAVEERDKLLPTIPNLKIEVEGPVGDGITVIIDGKPVPAAIIGQKRPTDPGEHRVDVKRADTSVHGEVVLKPSQTSRLVLQLPPLSKSKPPPPPATFPFRTVGFISIGVGGAGVAMAALSGGLAIANHQSLLRRCGTDHACPEDARVQLNAYDVMRTLTTVGIVIGAAGLGAGIPLVITHPSPRRTEARVEPFITFGSAGLRGTF